jgi:DNA-binding Lrp family transcriptional regulator
MLHPTATLQQLAVGVECPQATVQKRLSHMLHEGILERIVKVVRWEAIGYPLRYWIDVRVNQRELRAGRGGPHSEGDRIDSTSKLAQYIMHSVASKFSGSLIVLDVTMLLGSPADLSVYIRAKDHHTVLDFVTNGLRALGAVDSTTTFHEAWSCTEGKLG